MSALSNWDISVTEAATIRMVKQKTAVFLSFFISKE